MLANHEVVIYNFRIELIQELLSQNYEVYISLPNGNKVKDLVKLGCKFIDTPISRHGTNPVTDFKLYLAYRNMIKKIKPDVVLSYTIKPNVYGGLACQHAKTPYLANVTGLGTAVENGGLLSKITKFLYRVGLKKCNCVFFQNTENINCFVNEKIVTGKYRLIPGSGVNLDANSYEEYPKSEDVVKFIFVGRIMKNKGVSELLEAFSSIKDKHRNVELSVVGFYENDGYKEQIDDMVKNGYIKYIGVSNNVHELIKDSHAIIHPSYHEGLSNVLLEAAACGRPIIATNIPGCKETFVDGVTGFGCEVRNVSSLELAIEKFINLPYEEKATMGLAGRKKVEQEFDRQIVINAYIDEINNLNIKENKTNVVI